MKIEIPTEIIPETIQDLQCTSASKEVLLAAFTVPQKLTQHCLFVPREAAGGAEGVGAGGDRGHTLLPPEEQRGCRALREL